MPLSTKQLAYLNNLAYSKHPSLYDTSSGSNPQLDTNATTIGYIVDNLSPEQNAETFTTKDEWSMIKNSVSQDKELSRLVIEKSYYDASTGDAGCVLVDPQTKEAYVLFRGTGKGEWKDNALAGTYTDNPSDNTLSVQQQKALDFVNSLDASKYSSITVTGHSKGGNKAKVAALLSDKVTKCVSFDGQGFSDEFMRKHKSDIIANQGKIENHNVDGDYVNILLNDVGKTSWYEGQNIGINVFKYHSMSSFLNDKGEMVPGQQSPVTKALDQGLNRLTRSMPTEMRPLMFEFVGEVLDAVRGSKSRNVLQVLTDPRYSGVVAMLAAYGILDILSDVPVIGKAIKMLRLAGILGTLPSGEDMSYASAEDIHYTEPDTSVTVDLKDEIYIHYAGVTADAEELRCAVQQYNDACLMVQTAANDLAAKWEGDGKAAYIANQQIMLQYCMALGQMGFNVADQLIRVVENYKELQERLTNLM